MTRTCTHFDSCTQCPSSCAHRHAHACAYVRVIACEHALANVRMRVHMCVIPHGVACRHGRRRLGGFPHASACAHGVCHRRGLVSAFGGHHHFLGWVCSLLSVALHSAPRLLTCSRRARKPRDLGSKWLGKPPLRPSAVLGAFRVNLGV